MKIEIRIYLSLLPILFLFFGLFYTSSSFANSSCESLFLVELKGQQFSPVAKFRADVARIQAVAESKPPTISMNEWVEIAKLFPYKGSRAKDRFQFGFEAEYAIHEVERISQDYAPESRFKVSQKEWLEWSWAQRKTWLEEQKKNKTFMDKRPILHRISQKPADKPMPEHLHFDDTGNLEMILRPVDDLVHWRNIIEEINLRYGAGSMQGMISLPRSLFFEQNNGSSRYQQNEGWLKYMSERDVLEKLLRGAQRVDQFPDRAAAPSFLHPNLGPLTDYRAAKLHKYLRENSVDSMIDHDSFDQVLNASSFKYVGSTAYRPDVAGPDRSAFEVRDAHKDQNLLFERTARVLRALAEDRSQYLEFANVQAFPAEATFAKLDFGVQAALQEIFPAKVPVEMLDSGNSNRAWNTFRNFSYPMRDWSSLLIATHRSDLLPGVQAEQSKYLQGVTAIVDRYQTKVIAASEANLQIQAQLVRFAKNAKIMEAFKSWEKTWLRQVTPGTHTGSYQDNASSLLQNMNRLAMLYPSAIKVVPEVGFKASDSNKNRVEARRPVAVISTHGLTPKQIEELKFNVLGNLSQGTVSFPLKEGARHLYVRVEDKIHDFQIMRNLNFLKKFRTFDYRVPNATTLEPVVALSQKERDHLNKYIGHASENWLWTLGFFHLNGGKDPKGALNNNRCKTGGHNCTTWISTAPIGENNQPLVGLISENAPDMAMINPGSWSRWILSSAERARVPMAILWTPEPLEKVLTASVISGQKLDWKFVP